MLTVIASYLPYALITTFTPGPNNIMSFYSVSSYGWKKGSRVILGIFAGFSVVMLSVILFCHEISEYMPELVKYLKYFGAAYILWLAYHIAVSVPSEAQGDSVSFKTGFLIAISNVKVILYLITLFTAYVIPAGSTLIEMFVHGAFIIGVSIVSWTTWGTAGGLLQRFLAKHYRPFNIVMAVALVWCAVRIVL